MSRLEASGSERGKALRAEVERYSSAILFVCGTMKSILLQIRWRRSILEGDWLRSSLAWQQSRSWRLTGRQNCSLLWKHVCSLIESKGKGLTPQKCGQKAILMSLIRRRSGKQRTYEIFTSSGKALCILTGLSLHCNGNPIRSLYNILLTAWQHFQFALYVGAFVNSSNRCSTLRTHGDV